MPPPAEPPPNFPIAFGYKCKWLAVRTDDRDAVAHIIELADYERLPWRAAHWRMLNHLSFDEQSRHLIVTPPVRSWVLAVGWGLPSLDTDDDIDRNPGFGLLRKLSQRFGVAAGFASHRVSSAYEWAFARNGKLVRAFIYGDGPFLNYGAVTDEERNLELEWTAPDYPELDAGDEHGHHLNEEHVIQVAERWSVNPLKLDELADPESEVILGKLQHEYSSFRIT